MSANDPPCAQTCITQGLADTLGAECAQFSDNACLCPNRTKIDIIGSCIMASCSANVLQPAIALFENQCSPAISWSYHSTSRTTTTSQRITSGPVTSAAHSTSSSILSVFPTNFLDTTIAAATGTATKTVSAITTETAWQSRANSAPTGRPASTSETTIALSSSLGGAVLMAFIFACLWLWRRKKGQVDHMEDRLDRQDGNSACAEQETPQWPVLRPLHRMSDTHESGLGHFTRVTSTVATRHTSSTTAGHTDTTVEQDGNLILPEGAYAGYHHRQQSEKTTAETQPSPSDSLPAYVQEMTVSATRYSSSAVPSRLYWEVREFFGLSSSRSDLASSDAPPPYEPR
ncbi:hypothetical protein C8Q70DRAFT_597055 [Cubamyces menziesii]|nr:hypothetical protein C8Q70DRAFT_597055 [Cubamyces menziesii]